MNQPIQVVSGYLELVLKDMAEGNPLDEHIKAINAEIDRMGAITKKIMGIVKYETCDYIEGTKIIDIDKASEKP